MPKSYATLPPSSHSVHLFFTCAFSWFSFHSSRLWKNREPEQEEIWSSSRLFYRVTESTLYTFLFCFALLPPNVDVVALLRLDEGISSIKYQSSISILLLFCFFFYLGRLVLRWRETLLWLNKPCAIIDTGGREESSFRVARSSI